MFTAKLHRSFTHNPMAVMEPTSAASIRPNDEDEALAREGLEALAGEGKLGALLIQFPVSFKNTSLNREYVERLIRQFIEYPRVIEVRHDSWDNPETIRYFMQKECGFLQHRPAADRPLAGADGARDFSSRLRASARTKLRSVVSTPTPAPIATTISTAKPSWQDGKNKIVRIASKAEVTYVVTNNHFEGKAGVNALQLKNMITGQRVKAPEPLLKHYPELSKIADPIYDDMANPNLPLLA